MQEDVFLVGWVGELISWCNPNWEVLSLILDPSIVVLLFLYRGFNYVWIDSDIT